MSEILGYKGIGKESGNYVYADEALEYAMRKCGIMPRPDKPLDKEFKVMLVDWFFSGAWIPARKVSNGTADIL